MIHASFELGGECSCFFLFFSICRSLSRKDISASFCWSVVLIFIFISVAILKKMKTQFSYYVPRKDVLVDGHSLCVSADIWSLGVILFMLVCGQPPFQEANDSETLTMIMDCKYTVPPNISHACREWVTRTRTYPHGWTEYSAGAAYFMLVDVWRERGAASLMLLPRCPALHSLLLQSAAPPEMQRCVKCI